MMEEQTVQQAGRQVLDDLVKAERVFDAEDLDGVRDQVLYNFLCASHPTLTAQLN